MTSAKYQIGSKVQTKEGKHKGTVTHVGRWESDKYKGFVYQFKDGCGNTFFGYKESQIKAAE